MNNLNFKSFLLAIYTATIIIGFEALAQSHTHSMPHEMQHGFVLAADDAFASHLVASGHHCWQAEVVGRLEIEDPQEREIYERQKMLSKGRTYFLLQAQKLDLPSIGQGQILRGHIVESQVGMYEPKNVTVRNAVFRIERVLLNLPNPFFSED